ncbi:MAG: GNAT family N-acetyltransferase [Candidatus Eremiobacteraeota bacterium]|nr:GNAT family N-acetyltransferase [Candidatus Eremiobacteraeota bacterium]
MDIEPTLADHADETFAFLEDVEMWRYYAHQRPRSLEALRETYARRAQGPADPQQRWENWILREVVSRDAIGDLQATISCDTREASIAYGVFPPFRRRGYAREAVVTLLEHLRAAHGVERALAEIDTQNTPSLRLVRSLGFLPTGRSGEETLFERRLV